MESDVAEDSSDGLVYGVAVAHDALLPAGAEAGGVDLEGFHARCQAPEGQRLQLEEIFC